MESCSRIQSGGNPKRLFDDRTAQRSDWDVDVIYSDGKHLRACFSYLVDAPSNVYGRFDESLVLGDFESKDEKLKEWFLEHVENR